MRRPWKKRYKLKESSVPHVPTGGGKDNKSSDIRKRRVHSMHLFGTDEEVSSGSDIKMDTSVFGVKSVDSTVKSNRKSIPREKDKRSSYSPFPGIRLHEKNISTEDDKDVDDQKEFKLFVERVQDNVRKKDISFSQQLHLPDKDDSFSFESNREESFPIKSSKASSSVIRSTSFRRVTNTLGISRDKDKIKKKGSKIEKKEKSIEKRNSFRSLEEEKQKKEKSKLSGKDSFGKKTKSEKKHRNKEKEKKGSRIERKEKKGGSRIERKEKKGGSRIEKNEKKGSRIEKNEKKGGSRIERNEKKGGSKIENNEKKGGSRIENNEKKGSRIERNEKEKEKKEKKRKSSIEYKKMKNIGDNVKERKKKNITSTTTTTTTTTTTIISGYNSGEEENISKKEDIPLNLRESTKEIRTTRVSTPTRSPAVIISKKMLLNENITTSSSSLSSPLSPSSSLETTKKKKTTINNNGNNNKVMNLSSSHSESSLEIKELNSKLFGSRIGIKHKKGTKNYKKAANTRMRTNLSARNLSNVGWKNRKSLKNNKKSSEVSELASDATSEDVSSDGISSSGDGIKGKERKSHRTVNDKLLRDFIDGSDRKLEFDDEIITPRGSQLFQWLKVYCSKREPGSYMPLLPILRGKIALERKYKLIEENTLGTGAYSTVIMGINIHTEENVAIKIVSKNHLESDRDKRNLLREIEIASKTNHPNVVKVYDMYETSDKFYFVMEVMKGGDLFHKIKYGNAYDEPAAKMLIRRLLHGIKYIHSMGITHRDIKPENILLGDENDFEIKIADFGIATVALAHRAETLRTRCGTPSYLAPEIFSRSGYSQTVDMWSVGVVTYVLLSRYPPFRGENPTEILKAVIKHDLKFPPIPWSQASSQAIDFIKKCLCSPTKRMTAKEAVRHPWIASTVSVSELPTFHATLMQKYLMLPEARELTETSEYSESEYTEMTETSEYIPSEDRIKENSILSGLVYYSRKRKGKKKIKKESSGK